MSFATRGGWWVVSQAILLGLYVIALGFTEPVTSGFGLGYARVVGWLLVVASVVMGGWALALLGRRLSPFPAPTDDALLMTRGPFRLVRHPMYGAVIIGAVGLALAFVSPGALVMSLAFPVFFMAKVGHEEDLLMARFPAYRDYRSTIPHRLLPWLL